MLKKKNKADGDNFPTAERLVEMAKKRHQDVERKASKAEAENQKKIASLSVEENRLKAEIVTGKEVLEKMIIEFEQVEKGLRESYLSDVRDNEFTNEDVKSGRITMAQFQTQGKDAQELQKESVGLILENLEKSSDAIREKATEIVRLELSLCNAQNAVYQMTLTPIRSLLTSYVQLQDMLNYQISPISADGQSAQSEKLLKKNEITLIERQASVTSSGYTWPNITLKEAFRLRVNPIFPKKHTAFLLKELSEIEPGEDVKLTVVYHQPGSGWPGDPIEIREELPALPREKFKIKSEPVTTKD